VGDKVSLLALLDDKDSDPEEVEVEISLLTLLNEVESELVVVG